MDKLLFRGIVFFFHPRSIRLACRRALRRTNVQMGKCPRETITEAII